MKLYFPSGLGRFCRPQEVVEIVENPGFITTDMPLRNAAGKIVCVSKSTPYEVVDDSLEVGSTVAPKSGETSQEDQTANEDQNTKDDETVVDQVNGDE